MSDDRVALYVMAPPSKCVDGLLPTFVADNITLDAAKKPGTWHWPERG